MAGAYLANVLGRHARSEDEVLDLLATTDHAGVASVPKRAKQLLQNFEADAMQALERAVESTINRLDVPPSCPTDDVVQRLEGRAFRIERAKRLVRPLSKSRMTQNAYSRSKFPGLKVSDIGARLKLIERITDTQLEFKIFSEDLLVIDQVQFDG